MSTRSVHDANHVADTQSVVIELPAAHGVGDLAVLTDAKLQLIVSVQSEHEPDHDAVGRVYV